ncbi:hypothetical protein HYS47_05030 [Candidatus Woesearchaeota archaeon]|nr:hypothetical protein [Candidatus Woesearchaeota archaeon]
MRDGIDLTELEYQAAHTFKNNFWRGFDSAARDLVVDSLTGLWALRRHPHYYSYGGISGAEGVPLHEIIGFDVPGSELFEQSWYHFGFYKSMRDRNRTAPAPVLVIPDVTEKFTRGILTDVSRETKRIVLGQLRQTGALGKHRNAEEEERNGYPSDPQQVLQGLGLDIDVQRFFEIYADSHAYATFLIGFYLPHIRESSGVGKFIESEGRLNDPVSYVEKVLGLDLRARNETGPV